MSIIQKVGLINQLFSQLEKEISTFQSKTNLQCVKGCGICCTKTDMYASPLEFLPWAFNLFINHKAIHKLEELKKGESPICNIYIPISIAENTNGKCGNYQNRGLICRLFGFSARKDKYANLQLSTCKVIKEGQKEQVQFANQAINKNISIPVFTDYYMQLSQIDYNLGTIQLPINEALILAIEEVLQYYAYRPFPIFLKNAA